MERDIDHTTDVYHGVLTTRGNGINEAIPIKNEQGIIWLT
jgi:hypothetical protein